MNSLDMTKNFALMDSNIRHSFEQPSFNTNDVVNELNSNLPKDRFRPSQNMDHNTNFLEPPDTRRPSIKYSSLPPQKTRSSFRSDRRLKQDRNVNNASSNPDSKTRNFSGTSPNKKKHSRNEIAFPSQKSILFLTINSIGCIAIL